MKKLISIFLCLLVLTGCAVSMTTSKPAQKVVKYNYFGYNLELPEDFKLTKVKEDRQMVLFYNEDGRSLAMSVIKATSHDPLEDLKGTLVEPKVIKSESNTYIVKGSVRNSSEIGVSMSRIYGDEVVFLAAMSHKDNLDSMYSIIETVHPVK